MNLDEIKKEFAKKFMDESITGWKDSNYAFKPVEDITVSQWAAAHRILPKSSAIPGKWSNNLAPYAVGVMDAFNDPWVERITIVASVQSVKTESVYNMLGFVICQDPAPSLVVMPTLNTTKIVNERIREMLLESHELTGHLTENPDDLQIHKIRLDRMTVYFATAGSEADLQNIAAKNILLDETDEYKTNAGKSGDSIQKAIDRATTFWNKKVVELSRPTVPDGHISRNYAKSDRRKYWVPCPFCGKFQVLSFWQIKHRGEKLGEWPEDKRDPQYILGNRVACYECRHCGAEINDKDKPEMLDRGQWHSGSWLPWEKDNKPEEPESEIKSGSTHVGFWWNALYSPFKTFSAIAANFFEVKNNRDEYRVFVNQTLAEPWKEIIQSRETSSLIDLKTSRPPLVVPDGAVALTAGIDKHKRGFWVTIWAWITTAPRVFDQHLVRYGFVFDELELETWLFSDVYWNDSGSIAYPIWRVGKDTGGGKGEIGESTLTVQAYEWLARINRSNVFGIKGASQSFGRKIALAPPPRFPGGKPVPGSVRIWRLDTDLIKDDFWAKLALGRVHFHAETENGFFRQLTAEVKERSVKGKETWVNQGGRANHLLDASIYATAMADEECWGGLIVLAPPKPVDGNEPEINPLPGGWIADRGNWLRR